MKSHTLGKRGGSAGSGRNLALYRSSYPSKKHNLVRLGCEKNRNENALAQNDGEKQRREESCRLHGHRPSGAHVSLYSGEAPSLRHSHSPHNDVTVSPRSGREGVERRGWLTPCAPLCHPESTQVLAALCRRQTDPPVHLPHPTAL